MTPERPPEDRVRYFDTHLHMPTADVHGLDRLRRHLDAETGLLGGLLILNTRQEVDVVHHRYQSLPPNLALVPYFDPDARFPDTLTRSGWYKIHPELHQIDATGIPIVVSQVRAELTRLKGLMVHSFPWGPNLRYCVSLPLVIALAQAFPDLPILATHGGGYESWAFRAHTASFPNVLYDFSVSLKYFAGSDLLSPLGVYARSRPQRLLFGSDWPWAEPGDQLQECIRIGRNAGVEPDELITLMLGNAKRIWPEAAGVARAA